MRNTLAFLALLLLAACGAGACGSPDTIAVTIQPGVPSTGTTAYTERYGCFATITIRPDVAVSLLNDVIAHELGHAAGLGHIANPACFMRPEIDGERQAPCAAEAAYLAEWGATGTLEIVACPAEWVGATASAINLWNAPSAFRSFNGSQGE